MKKLTIGVLAMLACFACFAGCSDKKETPADTSSSSSIDELANTLDEAADYLEDMYKTSNKETRKDYEVVSEVLGFTVTWSADNDAVSIEQGEGDTKTKVVINKSLKEDTKYVLKATIADEDGNTKEVTFERTALKGLTKVPQAITKAPVEGVAYKYYVYQSTKDLDLYFAGDMDGYYFLTTELVEEAVDLYVEYVDDTKFNVYFNHADDGKQYIGVKLSDDGKHDNIVYAATPPSSFVWNADLGTITTHLDVNKNGEAADYYLGNYSTHTTISASMLSYAGGNGNNVGQLMEMVDKSEISDAEKINAVKDAITVQDVHKVDKEIELVASNDLYAEVSIAWSVTGTGASLTGNKLALTIPTEESTVSLTATFKCGETTDTKVFTLKLGPAIATPTTAAEIVDAAYSLATNETLPGEYTLTGVITEVDTVYSEQYQNVTVTIAVEGKEDKVIECYRMKGTGADVIKVGDTITVSGKLKNYNGKVEFDSNCSLDSYVAGEVTPPAGGEGGEGSEDDPTVPENAKTATLSIADYATANSWANGTLYSEVVMDGFTITASGTAVGTYGLNTGKYYTDGNTWRIYQTEKASLVITANEGITIVSVKVTYAVKNTGTLTLNDANVASDEIVTVNNTSITFGVANTGTATNGQAQIKAFEIVYLDAPQAPTYTLTLRNGNPMMGGSMEEVEYEEGATLELDPLTADGKKFLGWFALDGEGNPTVAAPVTMPAEPVALYAVWEVIPYTLTIKQDGVEDKTFTFGVEYTNDITVTVNDLAYVLEDNLPEGFVWAENVPETFELTDYTFTAISAEVPKYVLTLRNGNPMMGGSMEELEYVEGATLELPSLTADGKNFKGWFALDGEGNPTVAAPITMPAEPVALYAVWEVIPYTLTIKQDGAEDKTITFAVEYTNDITVTVNDLAYVLEDNLPANTELLTYSWAEEVPETFVLQDYTFTVKVEETVVTIEDALAAAEGTKAKFSGTVSEIYQDWSEQHKNISFYVSDGTNKILVFRTGTKAGLGDAVEVNGVVTVYNGTNQIAQGATVEITAAHVCSSFTEADCLNAAVCTVCGTVNGTALGHTTDDGVCERCNQTIGGDVVAQYAKVTNASDFTTGTYVLVVNSKNVTLSTVDGSWLRGTALDSVGESIDKAEGAALAITLEVSDAGVKIKLGTTYVKPKGGNNNGIATGDYTWAYEFQDDGTVVFKGTGSDTVTLAYNASNSGFRGYKNATVSSTPASYPSYFTAYKLVG